MKIFYSDHFRISLPEGHRFPMEKYFLLRERVMEADLIPPEDFCVPQPASDEEIMRVHDPVYLQRVRAGGLSGQEIRRIGFPWSVELVERARRSLAGTIGACRSALQDGVGVNLAGGTHHAFSNRGAGYCLFNDSAVAARAMQAEGPVRRVLIIDCDVHQGDGTAAIFADDPTVFTFSIHGARNFPVRKERSDLDIALADDTDDAVYLEALESGLRNALGGAKANLAIFLAGADPFVKDRFGRLALSKAGLAERDRLVLDFCHGAGIPVAVAMGGGYARNIEDTVDIHFQTVRTAVALHDSSHRSRGWDRLSR